MFCLNCRYDGNTDEQGDPVGLGRTRQKITHLFCDPTGFHVIARNVTRGWFYLHHRSQRAVQLENWTQQNIECVAFDEESSKEDTTGRILLGTI